MLGVSPLPCLPWLVIGTSRKEVLASSASCEGSGPGVCVWGGVGVCISDLWHYSSSQWMVKKSMW